MDFVIERHVIDVNLVRPNSNDGSIFLAEFAALENELPSIWVSIVVELIKVCKSRKPGSGM